MRISLSLVLVSLVVFQGAATARADAPRNIIIIYADDIGYGDVGCYGATGVKTPNVDRVASEGLRFTDGHSTSATCTPSRYGMLTGQYPWRKKGTGVLPGNAGLIIDTDRATLASMLKKAGYQTGVFGKWHLGLGKGGIDWNKGIKPGPEQIGFDKSFLIPATGDRVPCVYVENGYVVKLDHSDPIEVSYKGPIGNEPTGAEHPELLKMKPSHGHDQTIINGISRIGYMSGGKSARWVDEDMADVVTQEAVLFMERNKDRPFFLYFSTHDIHVPRAPHQRFVGKSTMGPRGDAIASFDWSVGEIVTALDRLGIAKDTMLIITSDNGPVVDDGYQDQAVEKLGSHKPAGPLRGGKYSSFEGGTRVPFIVRWPGKIKAGDSDALVCQIDFFASLAALTGQTLGEEDAPDSIDVLPALLGTSDQGRQELVEQARVLSLREGLWKYVEPTKGPKIAVHTNTELGGDVNGQLFDLASDLGERNDLIKEYPDRAKQMKNRLEEIRKAGRTRPVAN